MSEKTPPTSYDRRLLVFVALFLLFLFSLLLVQFYKIQIIDGEKWRRAADRQHRLSVIEPYCRGVFYSNTSVKKGHPEKAQPFVIDVPRFHLYADPAAIPEACRQEITQKLKQTLQLSDADQKKVLMQLGKKSRSRKLILWLTREMHDQVVKWWQPYARSHKIPRNALFFVHDYKRSYPFGKLLGQILHTVRSEREQALQQCVPTGGLELSLNKYLKGEDGKRVILRSPRQPLETGTVVKEPQHGADVYLTINHHLQAIAEEEIAKAVKSANATDGWAVMMDPYTGEILAWAQYPYFDPSNYREYFNDPKKEEHTKVKAITDPYEPGSTFKDITIAICLRANTELKKQGKAPLFSIEEKIATTARNFPGRGKPLKDTHHYSYLNMYMAMQKSSNVYMATLIQRVIERMGEAWYRKALEDFGMGTKTGIELPAESSGFLPRPGKAYQSGAPEWSKATPWSLAIGHNVLVNSLQMIRAYGIFANGGLDVKPTLVRKIVKKDGTVILDNTAPKASRRILDPADVKEINKAMQFVTQAGGTARKGNIPGYTEVGKTGTTEKVINGVYSKKDHISTFIGFAPANQPRFVLLVAIDNPEYKYTPGVGRNQMGGTCAAPAFKEIGLRSLHYLGVPQDDPQNNAWEKEVKELRELFEKWNHPK
ncbi:MAG: penicillin-binding protein 2 [Verrucomicrobia bacterium]|nr:penicillin-binding protein 2 [Verrucomicrobiota bacterium]